MGVPAVCSAARTMPNCLAVSMSQGSTRALRAKSSTRKRFCATRFDLLAPEKSSPSTASETTTLTPLPTRAADSTGRFRNAIDTFVSTATSIEFDVGNWMDNVRLGYGPSHFFCIFIRQWRQMLCQIRSRPMFRILIVLDGFPL